MATPILAQDIIFKMELRSGMNTIPYSITNLESSTSTWPSVDCTSLHVHTCIFVGF